MKRGSILIVALLFLLCVVLAVTFAFAFTIWSQWRGPVRIPNYDLQLSEPQVEGYQVTLVATLTREGVPQEGFPITFYRATSQDIPSAIAIGDIETDANGEAMYQADNQEGTWFYIARFNG